MGTYWRNDNYREDIIMSRMNLLTTQANDIAREVASQMRQEECPHDTGFPLMIPKPLCLQCVEEVTLRVLTKMKVRTRR